MDYTVIAMESLLSDSPLMLNLELTRMVAESEFIISSMENGEIGEFVQEATAKETVQKIINALTEFINKLISMFRKKTVEKYKKYIGWVKTNEAKIKEKAVTSSITLAPYWEGNYKTGSSEMKTLISDAFKVPYKDDDLTFASKLLPSIKTAEDLNDSAKITNALKNKFRFNKDESDNGKIKKVTLAGNELLSKVGYMIEYVVNYEKVGQGLSSLSTQWVDSSRKFNSVNESLELSKDMFLLVENTSIMSSDLCILPGFDNLPVTEKDENSNNDSLTGVENNNSGNNNSNDNGGGNGNNNGGQSSTKRYNMVDRFVKLAFSSYLTACEERFIVYIKCISQILGESPKEMK